MIWLAVHALTLVSVLPYYSVYIVPAMMGVSMMCVCCYS